jgi:hypothetical protein
MFHHSNTNKKPHRHVRQRFLIPVRNPQNTHIYTCINVPMFHIKNYICGYILLSQDPIMMDFSSGFRRQEDKANPQRFTERTCRFSFTEYLSLSKLLFYKLKRFRFDTFLEKYLVKHCKVNPNCLTNKRTLQCCNKEKNFVSPFVLDNIQREKTTLTLCVVSMKTQNSNEPFLPMW